MDFISCPQSLKSNSGDKFYFKCSHEKALLTTHASLIPKIVVQSPAEVENRLKYEREFNQRGIDYCSLPAAKCKCNSATVKCTKHTGVPQIRLQPPAEVEHKLTFEKKLRQRNKRKITEYCCPHTTSSDCDCTKTRSNTPQSTRLKANRAGADKLSLRRKRRHSFQNNSEPCRTPHEQLGLQHLRNVPNTEYSQKLLPEKHQNSKRPSNMIEESVQAVKRLCLSN